MDNGKESPQPVMFAAATDREFVQEAPRIKLENPAKSLDTILRLRKLSKSNSVFEWTPPAFQSKP